MAQSTTVVNGCDVVIEIDGEAGTLVDISGSSNQLTMDFSITAEMYRSFGSRYPGRLTCGKDAAFALTVLYSPTVGEGRELIEEWFHTSDGDARSYQFDIPDSSVGSLRYSGEAILESYSVENVEAGNASAIQITANILPAGDVTLDTIAS